MHGAPKYQTNVQEATSGHLAKWQRKTYICFDEHVSPVLRFSSGISEQHLEEECMNEASRTILANTVKEWTKFTADHDKFAAIASEVAELARRCVFESISFLKTQNIDVEAESPASMKIMKIPVHVDAVVDATFPNIKASVMMKCAGAARAIIINPNMTISAGGNPVPYETLKKGIPPAFEANSADFVRDAFLFFARTGGKEQG